MPNRKEIKQVKRVNNKFNYQIIYKDNAKYYTKEFLDSKPGQMFLKKLYKDRDFVTVYCTCNKEKINMHIAQHSNGNLYTLKTNPKQKKLHHKNCYHYVDIETDCPKEFSLYKTAEGTFAVFSLDCFSNTSLFTVGEILLNTSWENSLLSLNRTPKIGNLFHFLYNHLHLYIIKNGLTLKDIMYQPTYSKKNIKDIDEFDISQHIAKAYFSASNRLRKKGYKNSVFYTLMKLADFQEIEEDKSLLKVILKDSFKKGKFFAYVYKQEFMQQYSKFKEVASEYYISACITVLNKDNIEHIFLNSFAVIPVLKDKDRGIVLKGFSNNL